MIMSLEKDYTVFPSAASSRGDMGISNIVNLFQDIVTEHSLQIEIDNSILGEKSNAFWAVTKHKIKIHRAPLLYEKVFAATWPEKPGAIRADRDFKLSDGDGNVLVESRSEWVILDTGSHHIRKISDTIYPSGDEHIKETLLPGAYLRIKESVTEEDFVYRHIVRSSDIDVSQHTNNAVYVRLFEDCFETAFFEKNRVSSLEINYINESRQGDEMKLYKKPVPDGYYIQASSPEGKIYAVCILKTEEK